MIELCIRMMEEKRADIVVLARNNQGLLPKPVGFLLSHLRIDPKRLVIALHSKAVLTLKVCFGKYHTNFQCYDMDFTSFTNLPDDLSKVAKQQNVEYIAHVRGLDGAIQTVSAHLFEVAEIAVPEAGELIGLLHDFGKYSAAFQTYISTETGLLEPDGDNQPSQKGKIDHSTAGAQWIWHELAKFGKNGEGKLCAQILALCIASHHGGLIDNLAADGEEHLFAKRINKADDKTHLTECKQQADAQVQERAKALAGKDLLNTSFYWKNFGSELT